MASSSTLTNSKSFSAIIAKCGITNLQKTIKCGNTTGGNNIVLSTGDSIVGQTNITFSSTGASSNIVLNPGASGEVIVNGKLNVTGLIDPTGLVLTEAPAPSTTATEGALFVSDGTSGNGNQNYLYYRSASNNTSFRLLGGPPNEVIITTLTDFPTPVGGIITLDGTKHYRISGTVDITPNIIESNGSILIHGGILTLDRLITNNASALIRQTNGSPVQIDEVLFTNIGGPVYDIDGLNAVTSNIQINRNAVVLSGAFGTIKNTVRFNVSQSAISNCANGIIFDGSNAIVSIVDLGLPNSTGTFTGITITSTSQIGSMRITDCNFKLLAGQTAFDISSNAVVDNPPIRIDDVVILGSGTALNGITKADTNYEFFQCIGILNSLLFGSCGYSSSIPNIITTTNSSDFFDISGNYTLSSISERFDISANSNNGEMIYTGVKSISIVINTNTSISGGANNINYILAVFCKQLNGNWMECPNSEFFLSASKDTSSLGISECIISIEPGTRIKPMIKTPSHPSGTSLNVYAIHFNASSITM